jgi:5'-nucleotidase
MGLAAAALAALTLSACTQTEASSADSAETASASASAEGSLEGMRILMTNDDSMQAAKENNSDGLGLYETRKALCEAGADVVVVAPWAVQSGRGTAVTNSGTVTPAKAPDVPEGFEEDCAGASGGGAVYGLCLEDGPCTPDSESATPSDTVKFAMRGGLEALVGWDERPDLVVSGPNAGLNVASSVTDSGTMGAAIAALEHHVPAVALSTSATDDLKSYPRENYEATAQWATQFLEDLSARDMLSQHDYAVSVNYPNISEGKAAGKAEFTEVGTSAFAFHTYTEGDQGSYDVSIKICDDSDLCAESKDQADWKRVYEENHIGVSAITPDRTYDAEVKGSEELDRLKSYVEDEAPEPISS